MVSYETRKKPHTKQAPIDTVYLCRCILWLLLHGPLFLVVHCCAFVIIIYFISTIFIHIILDFFFLFSADSCLSRAQTKPYPLFFSSSFGWLVCGFYFLGWRQIRAYFQCTRPNLFELDAIMYNFKCKSFCFYSSFGGDYLIMCSGFSGERLNVENIVSGRANKRAHETLSHDVKLTLYTVYLS